ncbi:glycosyl transferase [Micromonospora coerulea]|uniref:Glycosyl transferase n=1 Tax=Micromonospora coerulea TaxID=47856 RepID=A0ABP8S6W8_9ACTN
MVVGRPDAERAVRLTAVPPAAAPADADPTDRAPAAPPAAPVGRSRRRPRRIDVLVVAGYLGLAALLTAGQWGRPERLFHQAGDQMLFEWMLARAARAVAGAENPLHSTALNAPDGVNLMANTSVLGLGVPLAPVTLLFGSQPAFLVAVVCCLAGTATAWYALLARRLVRSRVAAAVGGLCCGFAPGMVSQAGAHLHMAAQFLVPVILGLVFRPARDRVRRDGVLLGLAVAYQVFLGEEVLVFLALAAGVFAGAYALADPAAARRQAPALLRRLGVGALVAGVLLAYPLWFQFRGPGHYSGMPFFAQGFRLDAASFTAAARQTVAGDDHSAGLLSPNPTEQNSFFGPVLPLLAVLVVVRLWRRPLVRALAGCGLLFALLSLGPSIRVAQHETGLPGPYRLVRDVPLLDLVVPARFALVCVPVLGVLLALALQRADDHPAGRARRLCWTGAVAAALLPLAPTPIRTVPVGPVPAFVADGGWRAYVPPGRTLVPVPPVTGAAVSPATFWSARTGLAFTAPGGFFIGPAGPDDPTAHWGAPDTPTSLLLRRAAETGQVPPIGEADRRQAVVDLRHWRAAVLVQAGSSPADPVRATVDALVGPGQDLPGAHIWDVRPLVP